MKFFKLAMLMISPTLAFKAIAIDLTVAEDAIKADDFGEMMMKTATDKELEMIELYTISNDYEKRVFLDKVLKTQGESSLLNRNIMNARIDFILSLELEKQLTEVLKEVRRGGVRWASIGKPTEGGGL